MNLSDIAAELAAANLTPDQTRVVFRIIEALDEERRAAKRDANAERQRRHRARNALSRVTERDERDVGVETGIPASPSVSPADIQAAFDAYNKAAGHAGWPKATKLTDTRRSGLRRRVEDAGGLAGWTDALRRAFRCPLLRGENERGWLPDLDFFLQASSFQRLTEGFYDPRTPVANSARRPTGYDALAAAVSQGFGLGNGDEGRRVVEERDQRDGPTLDLSPSDGAFAFAFR